MKIGNHLNTLMEGFMSTDNLVMVFKVGQKNDISFAIISEVTWPILEHLETIPDDIIQFLAERSEEYLCIFVSYETEAELHDVSVRSLKLVESWHDVEYGLHTCNWPSEKLTDWLYESRSPVAMTGN